MIAYKDMNCCCVCGQRLMWVGDQLHCPDHYEVNEDICESLNEPGWRSTMTCASDEPPHGFPPGTGEIQPMREPRQTPYWMRSGRHG